MDRPAILLMGPTGAGKSELALELATRLPVEIVSVDSVMVYRGMDIGTAKPDAASRARVPHHLIDILDPADSYSAGQFLADAGRAMSMIHSRGRVPLLVGGTMLYFRALQSGLARLPAADPELRRRIDARAAERGWPAMHAELARRDPQAAAAIRPGDRQRIQRALEIMELSGRPPSTLWQQDLRAGSRSGDLKLVLAPGERSMLARRIEARFAQMMELGFLDEVRRLHARADLHPQQPAMRAVGYRQLLDHLAGRMSLEAAIERGVAATRQLARRQLTWLRAEPAAEWFDASQRDVGVRLASRVDAWRASSGA